MKKTLLTIATLSVLAAPMSSKADTDSFYIKANIGIGMTMDNDIDNIANTNDTAKITYDSGLVGSLAAGYDFANPMRMEIEFINQKNDLDITTQNSFHGDFNDGDLKTHSLMLNAFYDVDTGSSWTPFVGAGMGMSKIDINDPGYNTSDGDDNVFAYQFIGGVSYAFNEQWSVNAQYRFMGTSDATIDDTELNVNSNDLMIGVRFSF